jgi:hypothetical protein
VSRRRSTFKDPTAERAVANVTRQQRSTRAGPQNPGATEYWRRRAYGPLSPGTARVAETAEDPRRENAEGLHHDRSRDGDLGGCDYDSAP